MREDEREDDLAGAGEPEGVRQNPRQRPVAIVDPCLKSLLAILPADAANDLARIAPSRYRFRVWAFEPGHEDARPLPQNEHELKPEQIDELAGYRLVLTAKPIGQAGRDVLAYIERELTKEGAADKDLFVEWIPPEKNRPMIRHGFMLPPTVETVAIKAPGPAPRGEPAAVPAAVAAAPAGPGVAQPRYAQSGIDRLADVIAAQMQQQQQFLEKLAADQREDRKAAREESQRQFAELRQTITTVSENNPAAQIGTQLLQANLQNMQAKLNEQTKPRSVFAELAETLEERDRLDVVLDRIALSRKPAAPVKPPLEERLGDRLENVLGNVIEAKLSQMAGVPITQKDGKTLDEVKKDVAALAGRDGGNAMAEAEKQLRAAG